MLAIVIPYYKKTFFEQTLASLAGQTNKDFKVYIGNDASPDDPKDLVAKYASHLDIFYKEFDENLGSKFLTRQWDRCIKLTANEDWLMLLGDDDYLESNCIESFYSRKKELEANNIQVVRFASRIFWENNSKPPETYRHPKLQKATDAFYEVYFGNSRSSLSEYIFNKSTYKEKGFRELPLAWGSDNLAWLDFSDGGEIYTINESLVNIRMSSENISRKNFQEFEKNIALHQTFKLVIHEFLNRFKPEQRKVLLWRYENYTLNAQKITPGYWFNMCRLFFREHGLVETLKFTRRCLKYSFRI